MALDVQRISLDISKQPTPQQVRLGQGDANATRLIIDVFDDGTAYSLTNYSVRLSMHLPNEGGYYQVNGTKSGNTATFDIDERYAATTYGFDGFGYIDILNGDTVICSTSRFQLVVLRNAADGVELSEQYINAVEDAVNRANEAAEAAEGIILQDVPTMSATIKGGAKLGDGLTVEDDTLSLGEHEHSADDITSGVLPVARGGTGVATAAAERDRLGLGNTTGALPIANGGTGATNVQAAQASLNVVACSDQTNMGAHVGKLNSANQIWDLVAKCINSNNPTRDGHTIGLLMLNDGIGCYDWNSGGSIWKLGAVTTTTTTISNIVTAASGITITGATYTERNGVATLTIGAKGFSATGNITVGTIASGKRPTMTVYGCVTSSICPYASLSTNGSLVTNWASAASSASTYLMTFTYVLA